MVYLNVYAHEQLKEDRYMITAQNEDITTFRI
jgi:hypothetical protein